MREGSFGRKKSNMFTFQVEAEVSEDGKFEVQVPDNIAPGKYTFIIVVKDTNESEIAQDNTPRRPPTFRVHDTGFIDPNYTMRREEMYDGERG